MSAAEGWARRLARETGGDRQRTDLARSLTEVPVVAWSGARPASLAGPLRSAHRPPSQAASS